MAFTIPDYIGQYTIRVGSLNEIGVQFEVGDKFYIGTDTHHDPPPQGDKVGVSIYAPDGVTRKFPPPEDPGYAYFEMIAGNLVWRGVDPSNHIEYQVQFTLVELPADMPAVTFRTIYGAVLMVDPDVVGVWGADDRIP